MTTTAPQRFQSSDLSRHSTSVLAAAEAAPVIITRRDGGALVLMSEPEAEAQRELLEFAAQIIAVTTDDRGSLAQRMADHFSWMLALSEHDKERCASDLVQAARASFATGQPQLAIAELTSWRETATALAARRGGLALEWLDSPVVVERPE